MATRQCLSYTDFLGTSALKFKDITNSAYTDHLCVYALSASRVLSVDNIDIANSAISAITASPLTSLDWTTLKNTCKFDFVSANSAEYMCYKFKLPNLITESDDEPDSPYSYEELFDETVLDHMDSSTAMMYSFIYEAYTQMTPSSISGTDKTSQDLLLNNFKTTNNLGSDKEFNRSDYYKFFVPETDVVHDRSLIELNDDTLASVGNTSHATFNCILYCINPDFDAAVSAKQNNMPKGFANSRYTGRVIPISLCTYTRDISLAGNNIQFEPNLNGIMTVE